MLALVEARTPSDRYAAAVARLIAQRDRLTATQVRALLGALADVRRSVLDQLLHAAAGQTAYSAYQLGQLRDAVDMAARNILHGITPIMGGALSAAWDQGAAYQPAALTSVGMDLSLRSISRAQLVAAQELAGMQIVQVSDAFRTSASRLVVNAVAGALPPNALMRNVADLLRSQPSRQTGRLGSIAWQAERIQRQEMLNAHATADAMRMAQIADAVPDLRKWWDATLDQRTRPAHAAAERRYKPGGSEGPIPINADFEVAGRACARPHDPRLPFSQVALCRCVVRMWSPDWEG